MACVYLDSSHMETLRENTDKVFVCCWSNIYYLLFIVNIMSEHKLHLSHKSELCCCENGSCATTQHRNMVNMCYKLCEIGIVIMQILQTSAKQQRKLQQE